MIKDIKLLDKKTYIDVFTSRFININTMLPHITGIFYVPKFSSENTSFDDADQDIYIINLEINDTTKKWYGNDINHNEQLIQKADDHWHSKCYYTLKAKIDLETVYKTPRLLKRLSELPGTAFRNIEVLSTYENLIPDLINPAVTCSTIPGLYGAYVFCVYGDRHIQFVYNKDDDSFKDKLPKRTFTERLLIGIINHRNTALATVSRYMEYYKQHVGGYTGTKPPTLLNHHPQYTHTYEFIHMGKEIILEISFLNCNNGYFGSISVNRIYSEYRSIYEFYWALGKLMDEYKWMVTPKVP